MSISRSLLALFGLTLSLAIPSSAVQVKSFDVTGAGNLAGTGTFPVGINIWGTITGVVTDNQGGAHGFVSAGNSRSLVFDVPGSFPSGWTVPTGINDLGFIVGYFANLSDCEAVYLQPAFSACYHGFLRKPDGTFIVFDAPADTPPGYDEYMGIIPQSINNFGAVTGWFYMSADATELGFDQRPEGKFTVLGGEGFEPNSINDFGAVVGTTSSVPYTPPFQGFVATTKGITTFQVSGGLAGNTGFGGNVFINDFGVIAGNSSTGNGFLRAPNGQITYCPGFLVTGLSTSAAISGAVGGHAAIRFPNGRIAVLKMPAGETYSEASGINGRDVVTGTWQDAAGVVHGFISK